MPRRSAQLQRLLWLYHAFHDAPKGAISAAELDRQNEEWESDRKTAVRDRKVLESWAGRHCLRYVPRSRTWILQQRFDLPDALRVLKPVPVKG